MTWLDYAVIGVFAVSIVLGIWRGLVREVISILGWVIAFLSANLFGGPLGAAMPQSIPSPELRVAAAYVVVFVFALIVASLLGILLSKAIHAVGLGALDRTLGAGFGMARGALIVLAGALLAGLTSVPRQSYWRDSFNGLYLVQAALAIKPFLPQTLSERLRYD
jgi:membrane protein required for colicin V production